MRKHVSRVTYVKPKKLIYKLNNLKSGKHQDKDYDNAYYERLLFK